VELNEHHTALGAPSKKMPSNTLRSGAAKLKLMPVCEVSLASLQISEFNKKI